MLCSRLHFLPSDIPDWGGQDKPPVDPLEGRRDDLRFRVELWDRAGRVAEEVLAVLASASIGYAAFYAAVRDYPDRVIVFRDGKRMLISTGNPRT
jgi:hypothetical protein